MIWGSGLVDAYVLESKKAVVPRIIIAEEVVKEITVKTRTTMIFKEKDYYILDYLRGYGANAEKYLKTI